MNLSLALDLEKLFLAVSRPLSKEAQIIRLLKKRGKHGATNRELKNICFSYVQRIHDLRRDGHKIRTDRVKTGLYRFTLEHEDGDAAA